ncbi:hypothetical protein TUMEXPCC7403_19465 [Tumidithrix helvetica PCC 7403]|uniref:hypothetical protein n=1 Tax=Tumidithrix helvetica TaxID=3457545 RepID=UPI003C892F01
MNREPKPSRSSVPPSPRTAVDPFKLGFMVFISIYGFMGLINYESLWFLHNFDLIIHEAGHAIFRIFGEFVQFLGGTLMQLLVPIGIAVYFFFNKQNFEGGVTLFWIAVNLFDISRYMKDARSQELPLLGGEFVTHDWWYLFGKMNLLAHDKAIGGFVHFLGFLVYGLAVFVGFYHAWNSPRPQTPEDE